MTKKILAIIVLFVAFVQIANAIPAFHRPVVVTQPDGTQLTIIGHGDEFLNFITTVDGYTVVKDEDGFYHYANVAEGQLVATEVIAHEEASRNSSEVAFLSSRAKYLRPEQTAAQKELRERMTELTSEPQLPAMRKTASPKNAITKGDYRGLVILANYTDKKWRLGADSKDVVYRMMNEENFTGFEDPDYGQQNYTGSVHDYFMDNSNGQFNAQFDVVGPVEINYASTFAQRTTNSVTLAKAVLNAADSQIDFTQYDADGDGKVDMFYIIYAGYASSYDGNNSKLLWPHASNLGYYNISYDGMRMGRFACSTEIYGWESQEKNLLEGIGTIVHEFSHVLGYMDHYDTTYSGYDEPGEWDVMSGGSYFNYARTPVGYSAFERYSAGFAPLEMITSTGRRELEPLHTSNKGYRIDTPHKNPSGKPLEYFVLENRKKEKWDAYLPGEGMLITRIDSTSTSLWSSNQVNSTERTCVKLIRATGGTENSAYNTFPGKGGVSYITNDTDDSNLISYNDKRCDYNLYEIRKDGDNVSFLVVEDGYNPIVVPEDAIFYESFYFSCGNGGNDENYKNVGSGELKTDVEGWTGTTIHAANSCAVVGKSTFFTKEENIITPAITLKDGQAYKLSFSAAPYTSTSNPALSVYVAEGNGQLDIESVDLVKEQWGDYSAILTGSGDVKIAFGRKKAAFYIDTIEVQPTEVSGIENVEADMAQNNGASYNLAGQKVGNDYRGIVIRNGRKYVK